MAFKKITSICLLFVCLVHQNAQAQLYSNLGSFRNQIFVGSGYTQSFGNISYGINHSRFFKRLKRDVVGILDFSSPLSNRYFTRFVFRKGFQFDACKKNDFRLPVAIITSSVRKHLSLFNFHDIITDFYVFPGIYKQKYSIAGEVSLKVLWRHVTHYNHDYYTQANLHPAPTAKNHRVNLSFGIILGYNTERFTFLFRGGYQQITDWEFTKTPFYAFGMAGYKFNFKKRHSL
jgi:hypothetical protein